MYPLEVIKRWPSKRIRAFAQVEVHEMCMDAIRQGDFKRYKQLEDFIHYLFDVARIKAEKEN